MERSGVKCFHCTHVFDLTNLKCEKRRNVGKLNNELNIEGLNSPCDKNASAALWKRDPISDDYLPSIFVTSDILLYTTNTSYYFISEVLSVLQIYKLKMIAHNGIIYTNKLYNMIHLDDNNKE
jgi:hypothetical protein